MITINYGACGKAYNDLTIEEEMEKIIKKHNSGIDQILNVTTENIVQGFRCYIAEGKIDYRNIKFEFKGKPVVHDENGKIKDWDDGFCDTNSKFIDRILDVTTFKSK